MIFYRLLVTAYSDVSINHVFLLFNKLYERFGTPLKDWGIKISRGILTGLNEAFIIREDKRQEILNNCKSTDERERTDKIIRPILRGRDIERNRYRWSGLYLITTHNGYKDNDNHYISRVDLNNMPSLLEWFENGDWNKDPKKGSNHSRLEKRTDKGDTIYNLRDCAYMDDFNKQLIPWQRITQLPQFAITEPGLVILDSMAYIRCDDEEERKQLLAILNSDLMFFWVKKNVHEYGDTGFRLSNQYVLEMPVIMEPDENLLRLFDDYLAKMHNNDSTLRAINDRVFTLYHLTEDEIRFISSSVR